MSSRLRTTLLFLAGFTLVGISAFYALLLQSPEPRTGAFRINLKEMREMLPANKDELPGKIESLVIGEGDFPSGVVRSGDSLFAKTHMAYVSYRLVYEKKTIILDTAFDRSAHDAISKQSPFFDDRYEAMQKAMNQASAENGLILLTHEHPDHIGGLARSPRIKELAGITKLTPEQLNGPSLPRSKFPEDARPFFTPYAYSGLVSPAPGIVLEKSPGHSPGSQLVYVALRDGREFLFIGDIAWNRKNIETEVGRPLLISLLFLHEDRQMVADQLLALHDLHEKEPKIRIIVAHDARELDDLRLAGDIKEGFSP